MSLPGFDDGRQVVGDADLHVASGGEGPPVLLLHGFPETSHCWREVAPRLADTHAVVAPDLRGYGSSLAPAGGPRGEGYSKREMAAELIELMSALGHERFAVVGHDRGARVAYRPALDQPAAVTRVAVLNTVPTIDQFERMGAGPSLGYSPWFLLAQPAPFPERLLAAAAGAVLEHVFATWAANPDAIDAEARRVPACHGQEDGRRHVRRLPGQLPSRPPSRGRRPQCRQAHRSAAADRHGQGRAAACRAPEIWSRWAVDVTAAEVPGGHFVPEEASAELLAALLDFLG